MTGVDLAKLKARFRVLSLCASLVLTAVVANGAKPTGQTTPLPTLTLADEAHRLTVEEARRRYPVRLRAVVTYYDQRVDKKHCYLFVHDASGSIFVNVVGVPETPISPGALVEITGLSGAGEFAPVVQTAKVRIIGKAALPPKGPRVSMTELLTGRHDGQWVEVEGVVRSIREVKDHINILVALGDGTLNVTTIIEPGVDYERLIDARVRILGNAAPVFNRNLQMTGARMYLPSIKQVSIREAPTVDPFTLPVLPIDRLLRYTPNVAFSKRVRTQGRVTLHWPGRSMCIEDSTRGLCVQTVQITKAKVGELVDVVGFPAIGDFTPTLTEASFLSVKQEQEIAPAKITVAQALQGDYDTKLVQLEGKLIGKDLSATDPTMVLASENLLFQVILPNRKWGAPVPVWEEGSTLRITGICSVQVDPMESSGTGLSTPTSFRILLRSPRDVLTVQKTSWWTAKHLLPLLAAVLAIVLCALVWVAMLRQRIAEQTKVIQAQNVTFKNLSFQDGLTGIPNRRKFDETLESELEAASRAMTPLSLLILDIDHFKALNDEYGHQRGDTCLIRVAKAIASIPLREGDLVARYGGEEFTVILPRCEQAGAIAVGEQMRAAVLDLGIAHRGSTAFQCVSVSVGAATILPASGVDSASLIAMADSALYRSKILGRNRTSAADKLRHEPEPALLKSA